MRAVNLEVAAWSFHCHGTTTHGISGGPSEVYGARGVLVDSHCAHKRYLTTCLISPWKQNNVRINLCCSARPDTLLTKTHIPPHRELFTRNAGKTRGHRPHYYPERARAPGLMQQVQHHLLLARSFLFSRSSGCDGDKILSLASPGDFETL